MKTAIVNAKIVTATEILESAVCVYEDGVISYVGNGEFYADSEIDAKGGYLIPGFIDLHCHGGNGLEFMDATVEEFDKIAKFHLSHGTTTMLATTLAASSEETNSALGVCDAYLQQFPKTTVKGVHLEGPWLNPSQCGAQNVTYMKSPNKQELKELAEKNILKLSAAMIYGPPAFLKKVK